MACVDIYLANVLWKVGSRKWQDELGVTQKPHKWRPLRDYAVTIKQKHIFCFRLKINDSGVAFIGAENSVGL